MIRCLPIAPSFDRLRVGDFGQAFAVELVDEAGASVSVTSPATVTWRMVGRRTGTVVAGTAALSDAAPGTGNVLTHTITTDDTAAADVYDVTFTASFAGGQLTVPTGRGLFGLALEVVD